MPKDLPEEGFVQYFADNAEHNTWKGKKRVTRHGDGTFLGMGIISLATHTNDIPLIQNRAIKRLKPEKTNSAEYKGTPITCYLETETCGLSELIFKPLFELQSPYTLHPGITTDFSWQTYYFFYQHNRLSCSGLMQTHAKGKCPGNTCVAMLPIINLNLSDENFIYTILMFIQNQSEKHMKSVPRVRFDQPPWLKMTKIIHEKGFPTAC